MADLYTGGNYGNKSDSGSNSDPESPGPDPKKRRTNSPCNFDPCEFLRENVSRDVDDMSVGTVSQINEDDYEFATHVVKVKRSGQIIDVSSLWEMEGGAVSLTSSCLGAEKDKFKFGRMDSMRAFNTATDANEMLKGLRYFERAISSKDNSVIKDKPAYSWGPVSA